MRLPIFLFLLLSYNFLLGQNNKPNLTSLPSSGSVLPVSINSLSGEIKLNSVKEFTPIIPVKSNSELTLAKENVTSTLLTTSYYDGFGRTIQRVNRRQFTSGKDLVEYNNFDEFGNVSIAILPFVKSDNSGGFTRNVSSNLNQTYNDLGYSNERFLYSKNVFEESPDASITKQYAPGNNWVGSGNYSKYQADVIRNSNIPRFSISNAPGALPINNGNYNFLYTKIFADEDANLNLVTNIQYYNELGQLVCEGIYQSGNQVLKTETFFVYDDFGNLRVKISPKGVEAINANNGNCTSQILNNLCFQYIYNEDGLLIVEKVPGAHPVYYVYDLNNRVVLSQDGILRNSNKWLFYKYDYQGRLVQKGLYNLTYTNTSSTSITTPLGENIVYPSSSLIPYLPNQLAVLIQNPLSAPIFIRYLVSTPVVSFSDYQNNFQDVEILSTNYYDSYQFSTIGFSQTLSNQTNGYNKVKTNYSRNKLTGTVSSLSNSNVKTTQVLFYNDRGETIQVVKRGLNGILSYEAFGFDFRGLLKQSITNHPGILTIYNRFTFDTYGRLTKAEHKLNGAQNYRTIGQYFYDNLGRMAVRKLGGIGYNLNYSYNIRNWITGINRNYVNANNNSDYFGMEIFYDYGFDKVYNNGRIAGIKWRNKGTSSELRAYGYSYDYKSNLLNADYNQKSNNYPNDFVKIEKDFSMYNTSYDANGNILSMAHKAINPMGAIITLDDLNYSYEANSNKLLSVNENTASQSINPQIHDGLGDFRDVNSTLDFTYDNNGNLKSDLNKGISQIKQDWGGLNKPVEITFSNGNIIKYFYDANGLLLRKTAFNSLKNTTKTFDYIGNIVFTDSKLSIISHPEGRVRVNQSQGTYSYDYFIKDHIDNIRSIITETETNSIGSLGGGNNGISWPEAGTQEQDPNNVLNLVNSSISGDTVNSSGSNSVPVSYLATSEVVYAPIEEQLFDHLDDTRDLRPLSADSGNLSAARLNPSEGKIIGPGLMLKVMAGDQVELGIESLLNSSNTNTPRVPIQSLISSIVSAISGPISAIEGISAAAQQASLDIGTLTLTLSDLQSSSADSTKPMAFLNYLIFDENLNLLPDQSEAIQLSQSNAWLNTNRELFTIPQNGFLYIFSSNQSSISVRTDNLYVTHYSGSLLEEFHYYPFGLVFEASKSPILPSSSDFKYNHQFIEQNEFIDANGNSYGLNWYDFEFRTYDPQIGRWWQIDPLQQHASPYLAMSNNPILFTDPLGLWDGRNAYNGEVRKDESGYRYMYIDDSHGWMPYDGEDYATVATYFRERVSYLQNFPPQPDNLDGGFGLKFQAAVNANAERLEMAALYAEGVVYVIPELEAVELAQLAWFGVRQIAKKQILKKVTLETVEVAAKTSTKLITQFSTRTIDDAVKLVMKDPNKVAHLFAPKHNLGGLVSKFGGQENTVRAVLNAANGKLPASGVFNNLPVNVGGQTIFLRGNVINGVPRLGTMFIP